MEQKVSALLQQQQQHALHGLHSRYFVVVYSAMEQSKMLMEMQQPVQGMEETVPTVENQENYTAHTHFTPEEVKAAWQPDPEVSDNHLAWKVL